MRKNADNKSVKSAILAIFFIFLVFVFEPIFAYPKIAIVGADSALWNEIRFFEDWEYLDCQGSFAEYPGFVGATIHYCLHVKDERNHKIELRFSRHNGVLDEFAHVLDMTDFSENVIRIKKYSD